MLMRFLGISLLIIACGSEPEPIEEWIGVWSPVDNISDEPSGWEYVIFIKDGTWRAKDKSEEGVYQVFEHEFILVKTKPEKATIKGFWFRIDDVLTLTVEGEEILLKRIYL